MRTPDSTAGKKGKCPRCGSVMDIPVRSPDVRETSESRLPPAPDVRAGSQSGNQPVGDKIEFPCSHCGLPVRTPAAAAGKKGKCPNCGAVVKIPEANRLAGPEADRGGIRTAAVTSPRLPSTTQTAESATRQPTGMPATVEFACPQCGKPVRTPAAAAGKKGRCPSCNAIFAIPAASTARSTPGPDKLATKPRRERFRTGPTRQAKPTPGLTPIPDSASGLPPSAGGAPGLEFLPDDSLGLTPLPDAGTGLTPLGDAGTGLTPLAGDIGLTPLPDTGTGLTPLSGDTGLTPIADDPLGLASPLVTSAARSGASPFANTFGSAVSRPSAAANPYQSPSLGTAGYATRKTKKSTSEAVVVAPAIAMIVVASLSLLVTIPALIFQSIGFLRQARLMSGEMPPEAYVFLGAYIVGTLISVVVHILIIVGGVKMVKFQSWGAALTGAIMLILPCTACWIGLPIGVWAVIVLSLSSVRRQFR